MVDSLFSDAMQTNASHLWYAPHVFATTYCIYMVPRARARPVLKFIVHQDMSMPMPTQELVTKDLHGAEWRFKHIYRGMHNIYSSIFCLLII
jgi:hypothetical protein